MKHSILFWIGFRLIPSLIVFAVCAGSARYFEDYKDVLWIYQTFIVLTAISFAVVAIFSYCSVLAMFSNLQSTVKHNGGLTLGEIVHIGLSFAFAIIWFFLAPLFGLTLSMAITSSSICFAVVLLGGKYDKIIEAVKRENAAKLERIQQLLQAKIQKENGCNEPDIAASEETTTTTTPQFGIPITDDSNEPDYYNGVMMEFPENFPKALNTYPIKVIFIEMVKAQILDVAYQPIKLSNVQIAIFTDMIDQCFTITNKWQVIEPFWNRKNLRQTFSQAKNAELDYNIYEALVEASKDKRVGSIKHFANWLNRYKREHDS